MISLGVMIGIFGIAAVIIIPLVRRRQHDQISKVLKDMKTPEDIWGEAFDEDTPRSQIDLTILRRQVPDLVEDVVRCVFQGKAFTLEGRVTKELLAGWQANCEQQENISQVTIANVRIDFEEISIAQTVEDLVKSELDLVKMEIEFDCNFTFRSGNNVFIVENYNTPARHKAILQFVRERFRPKDVITCPVCQAPIMGTVCISCGHKRGSGITGFGLTSFITI